MDALKYPVEEALLHRLFRMPPSEHLLEHFRCHLDGEDAMGVLYVTKKSVAYAVPDAPSAAYPHQFRFAMADVLALAKEPRFFGPNLICFTVAASSPDVPDVVRFSKFQGVEEVFFTLQTLYAHWKTQPRVFGVALKALLEREGRWPHVAAPLREGHPPLAERVPSLLAQAAAYLEDPAQQCLGMAGLFQNADLQAAVPEAMDAIDSGAGLLELVQPRPCPHLVAELVKALLGAMPEPLFPFEYYDLIVATAGIPDAELQVVKMQSILRVLPREKLLCLHFVFQLLRNVALHQERNLLDDAALAAIFTPLLIRYQGDLTQDVLSGETKAIASIIALMITRVDVVFDLYSGDHI